MKRLFFVLALAPFTAFAQLPAPNQAGVAMGHLHIKTRDVAAQRKLWVDVLGGQCGKLGTMEFAKFPGVLVLWEKGEPSAGSAGSIVNHLGFKVRDLKDVLAKTRAAGITVESESATGAFLLGPDAVRIELMEDKTLTTAAAHHHVHFFCSAPEDIKAWYVKMFGAIPGRRANFEAADLPGVNLTFGPSPNGPQTGTKGRSVDHIGFEVKDLEAFAKKLEESGVKMDIPYRKVQSLGVALVFFTDPWGTYIELTEGLDKL